MHRQIAADGCGRVKFSEALTWKGAQASPACSWHETEASVHQGAVAYTGPLIRFR